MKVWHTKQSHVYHTSQNCKALEQAEKSIQRWEKEMAEAWGHSLCQYCNPEVDL